MNLERYGRITRKNKREIVLLKGRPCVWGKCTFCDYISDNETDVAYINAFNKEILKQVTGEFKRLEVINSGNVFELPQGTLDVIRQVVKDASIEELYFEAHWIYRNRLQEMRDFFGIDIVFKTGLESFDREFREEVLNNKISNNP